MYMLGFGVGMRSIECLYSLLFNMFMQSCGRPTCCTKGRFPLPEFTGRVDGCQKMHPSSRAVNSARELGP